MAGTKTVSVALSLQDKFTAPMKKAADSTRNFQKAGKLASLTMKDIGRNLGNAAVSAAKAATAFAAVTAAASVVALKKFGDEAVELAKAQIDAETKLEALLGNIPSIAAGGTNAIKNAKAELLDYPITLRAMTQGRGSYTLNFVRYEEVPQMNQAKIIEDAKALQEGTKQGWDIPEEDRDYYLERRYPAFGNLVPRDVASRAAKERCDKGFGVNNTGLAVFLDFSESIQRLGIDEIRARYGNLFDMYEEITDVNPGEFVRSENGFDYYKPMMIFPAVHYTMGGIWVDYELQTTIPGLFAIGECNFSDHGANRLGASALMQGLADGYFVLPYTIQNYLSDQIQVPRFSTDLPEFDEAEKGVQARIDKLMAIKGSRSVDSIHKELGHIMWEFVGMGRTEASLKEAIKKIEELEKVFYSDLRIPGEKNTLNVELEKALRLEDFLQTGKLMAYDALNREESCGGHFREEYQTPEGEALRRDDLFSYVACWKYEGEGKEPELIKEPLEYEYIKVQTRNYKN